MNNSLIAHVCTCTHCGSSDHIVSSDDAEKEFSVCYHCGKLELVRKFDAKSFLVDQIRAGITDKDILSEMVEEELGMRYGNLDFIDLEAMAGILVRNLYLEAKFIAAAEAEESKEYLLASMTEAVNG